MLSLGKVSKKCGVFHKQVTPRETERKMALGSVIACLDIFISTKLGPWVIRTSKRNSLTHTLAFLTKGNYNISNDSINGIY